MDEGLRSQIDIYLRHVEGLIERGHQLRDALATDPANDSTVAATRVWQQDVGVTINQLSGGSKAHWLARSFSEAFLKRSASGGVIEAVAPHEIAERLIGVLELATSSLSKVEDAAVRSESSQTRPAGQPSELQRFPFVHSAELRAVVERAYSDSRRALGEGRYGESLLTSCGVLEAIVTDALENRGFGSLVSADLPNGEIVEWPFDARLAVAEKAGIIRNGCARLPEIARRYRELVEVMEDGSKLEISERDARRVGQVLRVVMRDLDPGR
jgi:hypothetical protein